MRKLVFFTMLFTMTALSVAQGQTFNVVYSFTGGSGGAGPGGLTVYGSTMYGVAGGGSYGEGTIFQIGTDGSGFNILHSFDTASGANPTGGGLTLDGSTLYGMTGVGVGNWYGTVFQIGTDGSGYNVLHSFTGVPDGMAPASGLTLDGSTLYGTTQAGGNNDSGTIFEIGTNGSSYRIVTSFGNGSSWPYGTVTISGSTLYGMTSASSGTHLSGPYGNGTIYSLNADGSGFILLHRFTNSPNDGTNLLPCDGLGLLYSLHCRR